MTFTRQLSSDDRLLISFETKASFFGFILHTLTQISHLNCPWSEKWQRLLSIFISVFPWLWPSLHQKSYIKHRVKFIVLFRLIYFAFPLLRKARGIQRVLDDKATPGSFGFVLDTLKMAWGSRLFAVITSGFLLHTPLFIHVLVQIYSVCMVLNNNTLCTSPLLSDPMTRDRIKYLNSMTSSVILPNGGILFGNLTDDKKGCNFFFNVLHLLVGVFLTSLPVYLRQERNRRGRHRIYSNQWGALIGSWMCLQIIWAVSAVAVMYTS